MCKCSCVCWLCVLCPASRSEGRVVPGLCNHSVTQIKVNMIKPLKTFSIFTFECVCVELPTHTHTHMQLSLSVSVSLSLFRSCSSAAVWEVNLKCSRELNICYWLRHTVPPSVPPSPPPPPPPPPSPSTTPTCQSLFSALAPLRATSC